MRSLLPILICVFVVACDEYNSHSADKIRYGSDPQQEVDAGDPNFAPAFEIINTRCISCHVHDHDDWAGLSDNEAWISSGVVIRGDPDNSDLIKRIINSGHPNSNMPEGMGPLPDSEYQLLRKWIAEMP